MLLTSSYFPNTHCIETKDSTAIPTARRSSRELSFIIDIRWFQDQFLTSSSISSSDFELCLAINQLSFFLV